MLFSIAFYLGFSLSWNGLCPIRERIVESLASSLPAIWITHSLCSYVWKTQRQRNEHCITALEPLKHNEFSPNTPIYIIDSQHSYKSLLKASVQRSCSEVKNNHAFTSRSPLSNSHVLRGKTSHLGHSETPVGVL